MSARSLTSSILSKLLNRARGSAVTLPPLLSAAYRAAHSTTYGEHSHRRAGHGEKFWQFRPYDPSDLPRDIDWRASSRGDHVLVREKERQSAQTFLFWADSNTGMDYHSNAHLPTKHEAAIILSLGIAILAGEAHEMSAPLAENIAPGSSQNAIEILGQSFLSQPADIKYLPPSDRRNIPRRSAIILAGDFLSPTEDISRAVAPLAQRAGQGLILQVLDPAEIDPPFHGRVLFESYTNTNKFHVPDAAAIKNEYRSIIHAHNDIVHNIARHEGWNYILHVTGTPFEKTLAAAWTALAKGGQKS